MSSTVTRVGPFAFRTWCLLTLADGVLWLVAELQHTTGAAAGAFDALWLVTFFGFLVLSVMGMITMLQAKRRDVMS